MKDPCPVTVTFWSCGGASRQDPKLTAPQADPAQLCFEPEGRFYAGRLAAPASGALVLEVVSPRPLRIWVEGALILDESLFWRSFQRELRAAAILPVSAGERTFRVEVGERPQWPPEIDVTCPSRNREKIRADLRRLHPDRLDMRARVALGVDMPAVSVRFTPSQYRRDGVTWQHVLLRPIRGLNDPPPTVHSASPLQIPEPAFALASTIRPGRAIELTTSDERARGWRRFAVPVAGPEDAPPPLRSLGPEERRVEPALEVARNLPLTLEGAWDSAVLAMSAADSEGHLALREERRRAERVVLDMPAYESLGRLAPEREFRRIAWPSFAESRPNLPEPVLPDGMAWAATLYWAAWEMLRGLVREPEPESGLPNAYIMTSPGFREHQFVWDTSFTAMCTAYAWRVWPAHASLDVLYSRQFDGGYIHRENSVLDGLPAAYEPDFSPNPPLLSRAEWAIARLSGDRSRLARVYPVLCGYHHWLAANRRLPDGTFWTTGLANGLDNSPSLGDGYSDLTAQMAHDAETLARIARVLGREDEAADWARDHAQTGRALNERLWCEPLGMYATSLPGGGHNPNKIVTMFWPLWAGVVPPDRVEALARHLKDPASFWRHHPIPSLAADSPHFVPGGNYWLGSTWAPTNYAALKGFWRAGRHDLARETARRHLERMHEVFLATGKIWENYCSEASKPGSWSHGDYSWSALGPIAMLMEIIIGFSFDALQNRVRWIPPDETPAGVRNLAFGEATLSLVCVRGSDGRRRIEIESDRAFRLEVFHNGAWRPRECGPGRSGMDLA